MCHVASFSSIIGLTNSFADVAALVAERVELIFTPVLASSPGDLPAEKRGMGAWSGSREVGELSLA
jgi:hypothetical protein